MKRKNGLYFTAEWLYRRDLGSRIDHLLIECETSCKSKNKEPHVTPETICRVHWYYIVAWDWFLRAHFYTATRAQGQRMTHYLVAKHLILRSMHR